MKRSWLPILLIVILLGLLGLLATLQYQWIGQISDSEQIRLENRLKSDATRFAYEFNNEIHNTYFIFNTTEENLDLFDKHYEVWKSKTAYPNLIEGIYFAKTDDGKEKILKYNVERFGFESTTWTKTLRKIKVDFQDAKDFKFFSEEHPALIIPVYKTQEDFEKLFSDGEQIQNLNLEDDFEFPSKSGFLIVKLDEDFIKNLMLPNLIKKHFFDNGWEYYKILIVNSKNQTIYKNYENITGESDFKVKLFALSPQRILAFQDRRSNGKDETVWRKRVLISDTNQQRNFIKEKNSKPSKKEDLYETKDINIRIKQTRKVRFLEGDDTQIGGIWTFGIQHNSGSLETFVANTRQKNLAVSFGILSLLAISTILIFVSSQRAKMLAQKQLDFISSVSHEFRTPLSVIYSAGENLSDGIVEEKGSISNYGTLIKREGKKLSGMVEQILEFAGAKSGKRKYDFRESNVEKIINAALIECHPFIEEKNFTIEKEIAKDLPTVWADEMALTQAIQNLIQNSLKYSNGNKWLKISAQNGNQSVKIIIEDKGIGISRKDKKHIFEPFYRSENVVDEQISGNGLGLSLVKQIIDAHGGKISVESEVGKGSKFTIRLAVKKNE